MEKITRISVNNISKKFMIGYKNNLSVLSRFISLFSGKEPKRKIYSIKDVSFSAQSGEIVGIIGDNGSGKSTLLRIMAGIYQPDSGSVLANGKIISLINLIIGLKDRLTMEENIFLCCSLFGITQREIRVELQNIINFSGLKDFLNTKIYQFSEGMKQRLSFSIAAHCKPDVLLLDEVFEVGDEEFREKSAKKIQEIASGGACVISVTHDLSAVLKYCNRIIWLDRGGIKAMGNPQDIIERYKQQR